MLSVGSSSLSAWKRRRNRRESKTAVPSLIGREEHSQPRQDYSLESGSVFFIAADLTTLHAYGSSGCLGPFKKPPLIATADVPPKGLRKQGKAAKKPSTSEDFWITSTHDMDNSAVQSQGSISSASITNQAADPHGGSCNPTEFVNHGLILWNQTRQGWIGNKRSKNQTEQLREPKLRCASDHALSTTMSGFSEVFTRLVWDFTLSAPLGLFVGLLCAKLEFDR
ncbi:hypothetical protein JHK85_041709 [Glycine max]|nr:hypothetical protein JHK85_041709 [Glycine max]